jgi:cysteinyl-tRNA synthetase
MSLKFYNTLTSEVDEFVAQNPERVTVYSCGPTVYSYPHIGNWASYIYWDTLVRILMANDYTVDRVMNLTDVGHLTSDADEGEDKLEKSAKREGKTAWEIAKFYTEDFLNGMDSLGLITPQHIAKVTDYIPQQLDLVRRLKAKGFTYQISDGIYFDISKFPTYADFAHLDLDSLKAGARVEFNPEKHNSSDFALWKFTPSGEKRDMEWETPSDLLDNGEKDKMGFPGWHLECSAISMSILGETLDIHTGGIDHIPVHHTNEIAQSEAATGVKFCNYWLHNNHMKVNGTKISKSLGNGYTLQDLHKKGFSPIEFRMLVLQGSYRNEGNFTFKALGSAQNRLRNWQNTAALRHQTHDIASDNSTKSIPALAASQAIVEAVNDDLGTPQALAIIDEAFTEIAKAKPSEINRFALVQMLETIDTVLGLQLVSSTPDISDEAKKTILERNQARIQKDWKKADELRAQLTKQNIIIKDTDQNSIWQYSF